MKWLHVEVFIECEMPDKLNVKNGRHITDIEDELVRVLNSKGFKKSDRLSKFLTYIVQSSMQNEGVVISETVIAQDVFSKDETFDPRIDSIVRVTANRLRSSLNAYYATAGVQHGVQISIPVGSYTPIYKPAGEDEAPDKTLERKMVAKLPSRKFKIIAMIGLLLLVGFFLGALIGPIFQGDQHSKSVPTAQIAKTVSSFPLIVVPPFENETGAERYDFLERTLRDRLVEDLARFKIIRPVADDEKIEAILLRSDSQYEFAISTVVLDVEPEIDLLMKVVDLNSGEVIFEQRVKQSIETRDYYDSLIKIAINLSGQATNVISKDRFELIERQIQLGNVQLLDLEVFECIQIASEALRLRDSELYRKGYLCLEESLLEYPSDPNILAKLGTLKYVGALSYEPVFQARSVDPNISAEDGLTMIERALEIDPENASVQHYYSEMQRDMNNPEQALKHAELAYLANPGDPAQLALLSWNLAAFEQWERALALSNEAIERNPHPSPRYYYTPFLFALVENDPKAMRATARQISELDDYFAEVFTFLAAVANGNDAVVEQLRPQMIHLATRNGNPDAMIKYISLNGNEAITSKVRDLFELGGVVF